MEYIVSSMVKAVKFAREAAEVQRTHGTPGLGDHSIAKHSFNMVTLLLILRPDAPRELIIACLKHDIPERITGDMPSPAKKAGIQNHDAQERAEHNIHMAVFGENEFLDLSDENKKWLSGLDMLDFYCYCKDQLMLGNRRVNTQMQRFHKRMKTTSHLYPVEIVDLYHLIKDDPWEQMPDSEGA